MGTFKTAAGLAKRRPRPALLAFPLGNRKGFWNLPLAHGSVRLLLPNVDGDLEAAAKDARATTWLSASHTPFRFPPSFSS